MSEADDPVEATTQPTALGSGATVDEALEAALAELGLERTDVEVEVLVDPAATLPGERLSPQPAQVRVRGLDELTSRGRALLEELLQRMGIPARVAVRQAAQGTGDGRPGPAILDVTGPELGLLIGWRGETLRALQTVLNLMMGEEREDRRLILDVEHYRQRREAHVRELVVRVAERVRRTGQRHTLDPMHAYERRIVHLVLDGDPALRTESVGREPSRRVVIHPGP